MNSLWILLIMAFGFVTVHCQERVPPNIPPSHYQQPPPPQNMPQVPQQQYQIPSNQLPLNQVPQTQQQIHNHQVPNTQQQVPTQHVPVQQQPQAHNHDHNHNHGQPQQILNANIAQERDHIKEHMEVPLDTAKMSDSELQFHYFKMHDADNNNQLDGCELIKSLIHWHDQGNHEEHKEHEAPATAKIFNDQELSALIDPILSMDDTDNDGFISYTEFIRAQQKAAASGPPSN